MNENFSGEIALITGASSGLGALYAKAFHQRGANVVLVARREELLKKLSMELNSLRPNSAEILVMDLSTPVESGAINFLLQWMREHRPNIVVNNAGFGSFGYLETLSVAHELSMVRLNVEVPLLTTHVALSYMKERKKGVILQISSIAGIQPLPLMATYGATKAFDYSFGLATWAEAKPFGIRVLTVCPGPTETEFSGVARFPGSPSGGPRDSAESVVEDSMRALKRGDAVVYPGIRGWWSSLAVRILPKAFSTIMVYRALLKTLRMSGK
jgi:short-subunit dehydrogenase